MNRTPPLSTSNRFNVLEVYSVEDNSTDLTDEMTAQDVQPTLAPPPATPTHQVRLKRWERRLPRKYVIATTPSANSLKIKVEIVTTDTQEAKSVEALLDCGADGLFIDRDYVRENRLTARALTRAIPVYNVDGTPNEAGSIREVVDVVLRYRDLVEWAIAAHGMYESHWFNWLLCKIRK